MTSIFWSQSIILKPHCLDLNKNEWFIILHSMQNSDILHKNLWFGSSHFAKFLCKQPYEIFYAITKYFLAFVLDFFILGFHYKSAKKTACLAGKAYIFVWKISMRTFFFTCKKIYQLCGKFMKAKHLNFFYFDMTFSNFPKRLFLEN